jgi:hypothetical protein
MWRFFKVLLFIQLISANTLFAKDILYDRILKYNDITIEKKAFKVDSAKIIMPIQYFNSDFSSHYETQIIVKKDIKKHYFLFSILITLLILTSIVRYSFVNNFKFQLNNFLKIKLKIAEDFDFGISLYFFLTYTFCILYLIYLIFNEFIGEKNVFEGTNTLKYIAFFLFFIFKNVLLQILFYVFELKSVKTITNYINLDSMILISLFLLPLFTLESISNTRFKEVILYSSIALFLFFEFFSILKNLINNFDFIRYNFLKTLIYFVAIKVLPLILLAKFLHII